MTQEEKDLLLKDLCGRLSYGVKGLHRGEVHELFTIDSRDANNACLQVDRYDAWFPIETFKPYLRSFDNLTEEENAELEFLLFRHNIEDWLEFVLSHHLDWRNMIEKDLAIEAPEGMYK